MPYEHSICDGVRRNVTVHDWDRAMEVTGSVAIHDWDRESLMEYARGTGAVAHKQAVCMVDAQNSV